MSKEIKTVKCLSLFAGIGGFEVGMAPVGFRFTNTLEWDENCCKTLNTNQQFIDGGLIVVVFGGVDKKFQFPGAFEQGFLKLDEE